MRRISTSDLIYAKVLLQEDVPFESARSMHRIFQTNDRLVEVLESPIVDVQAKYNIIDKVFDKPVCNFLKVTVNNGMIYDIRAIYNAYKEMYFKSRNIILAKVRAAGYMTDEQIENLRKFIIEKFGYDSVEFEIEHDSSLIGGFVLKVDDFEYDHSVSGMLKQLKSNIIK